MELQSSFYINKKWKNIAKGHTAFCILGGPSSKEVSNLNQIIKNNFTISPYPDIISSFDNVFKKLVSIITCCGAENKANWFLYDLKFKAVFPPIQLSHCDNKVVG